MRVRTVLVVDDERYILEAVTYVVKQQGYRVLVAEDGPGALSEARRETPDLMLLDIMLPGLSGLEVCRQLKADPATRDIYIILLTALGSEQDEAGAYECGADEYLTKPFSPRALTKRLHELLDA